MPWQRHPALTADVTYTLCLLALGAVFVIRVLRIRALRRRERAQTRTQLGHSAALTTGDGANDGRSPSGRPAADRSEPPSATLLICLLPLAVISIGWLSLCIAGAGAGWT
jgi:HAMP domain-containing protein